MRDYDKITVFGQQTFQYDFKRASENNTMSKCKTGKNQKVRTSETVSILSQPSENLSHTSGPSTQSTDFIEKTKLIY